MDLTAKPGDQVNLNAAETFDPDGDDLLYRWWQYDEAGSYPGIVKIDNAENEKISFRIPEHLLEGTIHIICEVKDDGIPNLTRYQRVVITVGE